MAEATLERLGGAPAIAATLEHNVARLLVDAGRLEPALPHYRRAIALYQQAHGDDHPFVAKARFGMAHVHERAGRLDEARGEYEAAVAVINRALGEGHPIEGVLLEAIARVAQAEGQPGRAVEALEQAEQVHAGLDSDSVALAAVRFELARVLAGMHHEPDRVRALAQSASALAMHHHDDARARDLRAQIADWLTERESTRVEPRPEVSR